MRSSFKKQDCDYRAEDEHQLDAGENRFEIGELLWLGCPLSLFAIYA